MPKRSKERGASVSDLPVPDLQVQAETPDTQPQDRSAAPHDQNADAAPAQNMGVNTSARKPARASRKAGTPPQREGAPAEDTQTDQVQGAAPTGGATISRTTQPRTKQTAAAASADAATDAVQADAPKRRGRKTAAGPKNIDTENSTDPVAQAELAAAPATRRPRRGAVVAAEVVSEPEVLPETNPEMASEPDLAPVAAEAAPARRGRRKASPDSEPAPVAAQTDAPELSEPAQAELAPAAELADTAPQPAAPVRRGRKSRALPTDADESQVETAAAEPAPVQTRRGRKPRVAAVAQDEVDQAPVEVSPAEANLAEPVTAEPASAATEETDAGPQLAPATPVKRGRRPRQRGPGDDVAPAETQPAPLVPPQVAEAVQAQDTQDTDDAQTDDTDDAHPARDLVIEQLRKLGRPVHIRDFERSFTRQGREKLGQYRSDLTDLMDELVHAGLVIQTRKRTYGLPEAMNLVRGRFQASNSGFGFVIPDSGGEDYYIPEGRTMEAWNGDTVLIRPEGRGGRRGDSPEGVVVRVVVRSSAQLVGSLEHSHGYAFLKPDDLKNKHRIMLVPEGLADLPDGARLVTELYWPEDTGEDEVYGQVLRVLGNEDDPETETQAVVIKYGLRDEFPPEVLAEAGAIPAQIPEASLSGRLDLREYNIFTVDGRDAKDFDDAIHIQPTPEGNFVVGVHIADVSHYVRAAAPLDAEAYARATSVYLPGRVLPMLPEHLSNGVCSLVPNEDRLTLSALIELNIDGDILDVKLAPSVIRSKARLTYDEVQAYSEAVATLPEHARALEGDLHLLLKITSRLRQRRLREGALDFKMREVKVDVGRDGHLELVPVREETARGMIEDLMLLANKVVARYLLEKNVPALYRIHEEPTLARFQEVSSAIGRLGLAFPGGEPTPQSYQAVLKRVRGTPQETAVNTLLLRSMQQAKYAGENLGHFGLAFDEYLHFTSPIRRYPDLLVHRMLKASLSGELSERMKAQVHAGLSEMGRHTSERERTASEAERDLTKYYQAKWAQEHLGEVFSGYVSGVVASGLFVALENGVEGRIHISNLEDDYYLYIEDAGILKGKTGGRVFRVGENLSIRITNVNPLARQIEFSQESNMDGNDVKPRARRREDRETSKREKLSSLVPSVRGPRQAQEEQQQAAPNSGNGGNGRPGTARPELRPRGAQERPAARPPSGGGQGGLSGSASFGKRRIITLDRPRNEHLRPVNVTVQRMYFGDWTLENMPPDEGQPVSTYRSGGGGSFRGGRQPQSGPRGQERSGRPQGQGHGRSQDRSPRPAAQASAAVTPAVSSSDASDASDASKRRRRRRGRRGGNPGSAQG